MDEVCGEFCLKQLFFLVVWFFVLVFLGIGFFVGG